VRGAVPGLTLEQPWGRVQQERQEHAVGFRPDRARRSKARSAAAGSPSASRAIASSRYDWTCKGERLPERSRPGPARARWSPRPGRLGPDRSARHGSADFPGGRGPGSPRSARACSACSVSPRRTRAAAATLAPPSRGSAVRREARSAARRPGRRPARRRHGARQLEQPADGVDPTPRGSASGLTVRSARWTQGSASSGRPCPVSAPPVSGRRCWRPARRSSRAFGQLDRLPAALRPRVIRPRDLNRRLIRQTGAWPPACSPIHARRRLYWAAGRPIHELLAGFRPKPLLGTQSSWRCRGRPGWPRIAGGGRAVLTLAGTEIGIGAGWRRAGARAAQDGRATAGRPAREPPGGWRERSAAAGRDPRRGAARPGEDLRALALINLGIAEIRDGPVEEASRTWAGRHARPPDRAALSGSSPAWRIKRRLRSRGRIRGGRSAAGRRFELAERTAGPTSRPPARLQTLEAR